MTCSFLSIMGINLVSNNFDVPWHLSKPKNELFGTFPLDPEL